MAIKLQPIMRSDIKKGHLILFKADDTTQLVGAWYKAANTGIGRVYYQSNIDPLKTLYKPLQQIFALCDTIEEARGVQHISDQQMVMIVESTKAIQAKAAADLQELVKNAAKAA